MFIDDTTPIAALTVGNLKQLITDLVREQKADAIPLVTQAGKRFVYGLKGIQDLFGTCYHHAGTKQIGRLPRTPFLLLQPSFGNLKSPRCRPQSSCSVRGTKGV